MNIFVTSNCPKECAEFLDNKRVIKMCLETTQILSTAVHLNGGVGPYKPTHIHHPVVKWAAESKPNYLWLLDHLQALCDEYKKRYNKTHKCISYFDTLLELSEHVPGTERSPFVNCARNKSKGLDYTHLKDVFQAYTEYIHKRWELEQK